MSVPGSHRDRRLDTLRGLFLVIMLIDHLGGYIASFTYQPFGFVSAAEGFIFLSGLMFGQIYSRYTEDAGLLRRRAFKRAWLIYRYHLAMVLSVALLALIPFFGDLWYWALKPYREAPLTTALGMVTLTHLPGYLDILPMYLLFILASVPVLHALQRGWGGSIVVLSVALWLLGQAFNPLVELYRGLGISLNPGYFNLFSWQILWVCGLLLGWARLHGVGGGFVLQRSVLWLALTLNFVLWLYRREYVLPEPWLLALIDKPNLGPLRLFNCMLLILIGWRVMNLFRLAQCLPFFELLGRYSIQVFSFHAVLLYLTQYTTEWLRPFGEGWFTLYTLFLVSCLLIPVVLYRRWEGVSNVGLLHVAKG